MEDLTPGRAMTKRVDRIGDLLADLSESELRELAAIVKSMFARLGAEAGGAGKPDACPRCGHEAFVKRGLDSKGRQRWVCKGCGRTFTAASCNVVALSKLPLDTWCRFIERMLAGDSLRLCALRCGVSLKTSHFMRMRVLEVMSRRSAPFLADETSVIETDEMFVSESFKGNWNASDRCLPRPPHATGHDAEDGGYEQKVFLSCGVADNGDAFAVVGGRGIPDNGAMRACLEGRIPGGSTVVADMHSTHKSVLPELGAKFEGGTSDTCRDGFLMRVNALHAEIRGFLRRFNGVATRNLQYYLDWFVWARRLKRSAAAPDEIACGQTFGTAYSRTRAVYRARGFLFFEYWEEKRASTPLGPPVPFEYYLRQWGDFGPDPSVPF